MADRQMRIKMDGQAAFSALVKTKDPDAALLYALAASRGGAVSEKDACDMLGFEEKRLRRAAEMLTVFGLFYPPEHAVMRKEPDFEPAELAKARESDPAFGGLCGYMEAALGRILRKSELETLLGVYETLNLPADVLVLIINYCKSIGRLSAREIERQAYSWHDRGIDTYERAEKHIEMLKERRSRGFAILSIFGIQDRRPSDTEQKYIDLWTQCGFSDQLIKLAYDRTVLRTGKLSWSYMNKILQSWKQQGISTPQEAELMDSPAKAVPKQPRREESVEAYVARQFKQKREKREERLKSRLEELMALSPRFAENEKALRLCSSKAARASGAEREKLEERKRALALVRQHILAELGKPPDWLDDSPDCPICNDMGYIGAKMCQCMALACQKEEERRKQK